MPELKRCSFCGERVGRFEYDLETGICLVACSGCSATIQAEAADSRTSKEAATEAWNRRTPDYRTLVQGLAIPLLAFLRVLTCPECVKRGTFECCISCDERPFLSPCEMALVSLADAKDAGLEAP